MATPVVNANLVNNPQQVEYAQLVKHFGGTYRNSFDDVYRSKAGDYFGKLCTPLAVQFCLQNDFLMFLALGGMRKCIETFEQNQALLGKLDRLRTKMSALEDQYNSGTLHQDEMTAVSEKYGRKEAKLRDVSGEIGGYTTNVLYEGKLTGARQVTLDRSLADFVTACLRPGKSTLLIQGLGVDHTLGISVGLQVILFDPDCGFSAFESTADLGRFLEYFVKTVKHITGGTAILGNVG